MKSICSNFSTAVKNALSNIEDESELFTVNNGRIEFQSEGVKNLSIEILTKTGQLIDQETAYKELSEAVKEFLEDCEVNLDGISEDEAIKQIISKILNEYKGVRFLRKELKPDKSNSLPRLTSTFSNSFLGDNTIKLFAKWFNSDLITKIVQRKDHNKYKIVTTASDLNTAIRGIKQQYVNNIINYLRSQGVNVGKCDLYITEKSQERGLKLNVIPYNMVLLEARAYFSNYLVNGKYKSSGDSEKDLAYYSYFALLNFDKLISSSNFSGIVSVSRAGIYNKYSNTIPAFNIEKYDFAFKQTVNQVWDEELSKESDEVNVIVKKYIENLGVVKLNEDGSYEELPNQYLTYKNYKEVLRILKEDNVTSPLYSKIRNNPYSIEELFTKANEFRNQIFQGINESYVNYFDTMYYKLFSDNNESLNHNSSKADFTFSEFDLYGMIINQINKTSFITYTQYIWDSLDNVNRVSVLDSANIGMKKFEIERNVMGSSLYKQTRENTLRKWNTTFTGESGTTLNYFDDNNTSEPENLESITLTNNGDTLKIEIGDNSTPVYKFNDKKITKLSLKESSDFTKFLSGLLNDFLFFHTDEAYMHVLDQLATSERDRNSILDVITTSILNMNILDKLEESPKVDTIRTLYPNIKVESTDEWKLFNIATKSMKLTGFFRSIRGLELLATTNSLINGDNSKSNVNDAVGNKLQKERLTNLTNDDAYLFNLIQRNKAQKLNQDDTMNYNILINNGDQTSENKLLVGTELKTYYNSPYSQDPKKINKATDSEINYISFIHDFLTRKGRVSIQPTVYSDKSTIWNKLVATDVKLNAPWVDEKYKKSLEELLPEEIRELKYTFTKNMSKVYLNQVLSDYKKLLHTNRLSSKSVDDLISEYDLNNENVIKQYENFFTFFRKENINQVQIESALRYLKHTTGRMLTLVDQIHWVLGKDGSLNINPALYSFFKLYANDDKNTYNKQEKINKGLYALKLQENTKIELSYNNGKKNDEILEGIDYHLDQMGMDSEEFNKNWIDEGTNELILFKASKGGKTLNYVIETDVFSDDFEIELNPLLDKFLTLDNFIASSYNSAVYGLPFMHPAKGAIAKSQAVVKLKANQEVNDSDYFKFNFNDIYYEDAARTNASYKRAVIGGATIHTWLKNKYNGIPNTLRLAVIEDLKDYVANIHGDVDKATIFDGGIQMNPFQAIWEKNSVEELKQSEIHRKPIGYYSLSNYLSSGLMKCATFSIDNTFIRNSLGPVNAENLLKKMSDEAWKVPVTNINISNVSVKRKIDSSTVLLKNASTRFLNPRYKETLNDNGTQKVVIKEITDINYVSSEIGEDGVINNYYEVVTNTYSLNGELLETSKPNVVNINSNYKLWKVLGGSKSVSYNGNYDNSSIETVANLASNISYSTQAEKKEAIKVVDDLFNNASEEIKLIYKEKFDNIKKDIRNSGKYFQPLKYSDVSYLANQSAIKNGAINLLGSNNYYNDDELLYIQIDPDFIGIQMSAEHNAENSEISEMTQVISALIQKGISYETTMTIYRDLGTYISEGLKPYMDTNNDQLIVTLGKQLLKAFDTGDLSSESLASRYISLIKEDLMQSEATKDLFIPFDDPGIFNKFVIDFANNINQNIIRRKFFGVNAVLNPSSDIIGLLEFKDENGISRIYTREDYESKDGVQTIDNIPNTKVDPGEILMGDTILDEGVEKKVSIKTEPSKGLISLQELRDKYRANPESKLVERVNKKGRNLRAHNYTFDLGERGKYDGFDMDSSRLSYSLNDTLKKVISISLDGTIETLNPQDLDILRLKKLINFVASKESLYTGTLENLITNINGAIEGNKSNLKQLQLIIKEWILSDCKRVQDKKEFPSLVEWSGENVQYIPIEGDIKYSPNEMLLPKVWATKYMLDTGDNLGTILENPVEFFKNKLKTRFSYDNIIANTGKVFKEAAFALKGIHNNEDWYVINNEDAEDLVEFEPQTEFINNKLYVIDSKGKPVFPIKWKTKDTKGMKFYHKIIDGEIINVVAIDNFSDLNFIENNNYFSDTLVLRTDEEAIKDVALKSKLVSKDVKSLIKEDSDNLDELILDFYDIPDITIDNMAQKMAISFKEAALNFIVARIPAQSMQSFMNMSIRGFINTDSNVVYINKEQLWLQGSKLTNFKKS